MLLSAQSAQGIFESVLWVSTACPRDPDELDQRDVPLASFELAHPGLSDPEAEAQFALAQARAFSDRTEKPDDSLVIWRPHPLAPSRHF